MKENTTIKQLKNEIKQLNIRLTEIEDTLHDYKITQETQI